MTPEKQAWGWESERCLLLKVGNLREIKYQNSVYSVLYMGSGENYWQWQYWIVLHRKHEKHLWASKWNYCSYIYAIYQQILKWVREWRQSDTMGEDYKTDFIHLIYLHYHSYTTTFLMLATLWHWFAAFYPPEFNTKRLIPFVLLTSHHKYTQVHVEELLSQHVSVKSKWIIVLI